MSGESDIPELNGLGINDYSITLIEDEGSGIGSTLSFTFTVTGNSLPETLPPGTYTKIVEEGTNVFIHDNKKPETWDEYEEEDRIQRGLDKFGENSAVQAVHAYLTMTPYPYLWNIPAYGEWTYEDANSLYNYVCKFYGDENMQVALDEMLSLILEKFGFSIDESKINWRENHCSYDKETNIVQYADTRGYEAVHRFLDVCKEGDVTLVTVQLFADRLYLIPSHEVVYKIGEGEVFLGCEIIQEGNYEPRELS